jgi:hypothetical protein
VTAPPDRPYLFHAFEVSYFSARVRPALRYKRLWYDEVHADDRALDLAARKPVDEAVAGTGWEAVLAHEPRHRLARRNFKLVFETP